MLKCPSIDTVVKVSDKRKLGYVRLGSTFKVSLPLLAVSAADTVVVDSAKRAAQHDSSLAVNLPDLQGIRILVVDDEADARDMLRTLLKEFGADVITASSAREGFDVMSAWKPDVLVSDIGMLEDD